MSATGRMGWRAVAAAVLRESRASRGRLFFFTACLALGVVAVVGVTGMVTAIEDSLREQSRTLLAADLRVTARRPLPPELEGFFAEVVAAAPHPEVASRLRRGLVAKIDRHTTVGERGPA